MTKREMEDRIIALEAQVKALQFMLASRRVDDKPYDGPMPLKPPFVFTSDSHSALGSC